MKNLKLPHPLFPLQGESLQGEPLSTLEEMGIKGERLSFEFLFC
jgi:hypothetical protein